ncbi:MAG: carbamoyl-phosphate synthase (glutamine-hydrolyzing) large subunit [Chlorobi bacterium]|nr:carbamoyl-phosphate synthase (glutamine-hydrolyzing) large subunit [Chlorobiota bacterium]MCI0715232.1 carbamoyl-phosphate synthase (glutamine-hydrolyzing) large subunit [Chlorobiota bacterium]
MSNFNKILLLGSGALKIGEAGEFDYSGSQAIKALKEEGKYVILVNPNIATVQTDIDLADKVYLLPVNPYFVEKVIMKERPDAIMLGFGGQTALNCGLELEKLGILKKCNITVLGTNVDSINKTEDRELFVNELNKINVKTPKSVAVTTPESGLKASKEIGYPVILRSGFALGGLGSAFAKNDKELKKALKEAFSYSPQVLIEEDLRGWKEIEYEVVRDSADNCITVCNMENFDPLGIHTGESIVIAPSQTLSNAEYHLLRDVSIKTIRHFKIQGECNIQFALNPESFTKDGELDYRVIEVNARLSRSSALASKVTGYPLAYIAAKIALGYKLTELENSITKKTYSCFEPALDYVALKIPRWDLQKFPRADEEIGSKMKSVGEVMAIGRSFPEVLQKAIRMLQVGKFGLVLNKSKTATINEDIVTPSPRRLFAISRAFREGYSVDEVYRMSKIDKWFLQQISLVDGFRKLKIEKEIITRDFLLEAKKLGYSDKQIGLLVGTDEDEIRKIRKELGVLPVFKQIDTLAAEYPAETNYLYSTYHGETSDIEETRERDENKIMILGSGPYKIGSSVEFDWCCVTTAKHLRKLGYKVIMVNYNPETVSTDYDICDKLYFEELSLERVLDIYEYEKPLGIIISMGGQIPNNLALKLHDNNVWILGTSPHSIDKCEDRNKFSSILDKLEIDQPEWQELADLKQAKKFSNKIGYPVLIRPSYVLSGTAMKVCYDDKSLDEYIKKNANISEEFPVVISKFEEGAKEIEIDGVAQKGELIIYAISEHIENAGVHSGDATLVIPPQKLYFETVHQLKKITKAIVGELKITGPFNIQFLAKENKVKVIECNLRASRSFPFISKATGYNFIEFAVKSILGMNIKGDYKTLDLDHIVVKAPQFSFSRLSGADPILGVEMSSTGEVACFGDELEEAFLKSLISTGFRLPGKNILLTLGELEDKIEFLDSAGKLSEMGYKIYATTNTHKLLKENGIRAKRIYKISEKKSPNILSHLEKKKFDLVINTPSAEQKFSEQDGYIIRRKAIDYNIPLINNIKIANLFVNSIYKYKPSLLEIKSMDEY